MIIVTPCDYIVPIEYMKVGNLGLDDTETKFRESLPMINMEMIQKEVQKKAEYIFFKVRDLSKLVDKNNIFNIYEGVFKGILMAHANNVPCFKVLKKKTINGINSEQILAMNLAKFKEVYDFHFNAFDCALSDKNKKCIDSKSLALKVDAINSEIDMLFKEMLTKVSKVSIESILNMHLFMMKIIMGLFVQNVPCFEKAKDGFNGMTTEAIMKMHSTDFINMFDMQIKDFDFKLS